MGDTCYSCGDEVLVFVTHLDLTESECFFYATLGIDADEINTVSENIETFISDNTSDASDVTHLDTGDLCIALFEEDSTWYRAKVLNRNDTAFQVFFIDYGNIENVDITKIKVGNEIVFATRALATKCKLANHNVCPGNRELWTSAEKKQIEELLYNEEFNGKIITSGRIYEIQLKKDDQLIEQTLYALGNQTVDMLGKHTSPTATLQQEHLEIGREYCSYISYVDSADKFWIQLQKYEDDLAKLMSELAEYFESYNLKNTVQSVIGTLCVAKFSEDDTFYRAMITAISSENICSVQFLDYGNSEDKPIVELYPLPKIFYTLPIQAIKCALQMTNADSVCLTESLEKLSSESVMVAVVSNALDSYVVCINNLRKTIVPNNNKSFVPLVLKNGVIYDIGISNFDSPGSFYIQLIDNARVLEKLMMAVEQNYDNLPALPLGITIGTVCLAKFSDAVVYRGQILKGASDLYNVLAVDFGHTERVNCRLVKPIPLEYKNLPAQCIHCSLDIQRDSWTADDHKLMNSLISQPLVAKFKSVSSECYQIDLYDTKKNDRHINSEVSVIQSKVETVVKNLPNLMTYSTQATSSRVPKSVVPHPDIAVHTTESICVTAVISPTSFYGQLMKTPVDKVADLQAQLNSVYESSQPIPDIQSTGGFPEAGTFCCANYSNSGWYRAMITGNSGDKIEVSYIDFGDKELKSAKELKYLQPELCKLPQQCIICEFCPGVVQNSKQDVEKSLLNQPIEVLLGSEGGLAFPCYQIELSNHPKNGKIKAALFGSDKKSESFEREKSEGLRSERRHHSYGSSQGFKSHGRQTHRSADEYTAQVLDVGSREDILITHVIQPDSFHCQLNKNSIQLDKLMDDLHRHYSTLEPEQEQLEHPNLMRACVAQYSVDQGWYRAKITGLLSTGLAEVLFTDYGNCECMPRENLKIIKPEYLTLSSQAVLCSLRDNEQMQLFRDVFLAHGKGRRRTLPSLQMKVKKQTILQLALLREEASKSWDDVSSWMTSLCPHYPAGMARYRIQSTITEAETRRDDFDAFLMEVCDLDCIGVTATQGFWSPEHIAQFEDMFLDQTCKATFHSFSRGQESYSVELKDAKGQSLNNKFGLSTNSICLEANTEIGGFERSVKYESDMDLKVRVSSCGEGDALGTDKMSSWLKENSGKKGYGGGDGFRDSRSSDSFAGGSKDRGDSGGFGANRRKTEDDDWDSGNSRASFGGQTRDISSSGFGGERRDGNRFGGSGEASRFGGDRGGKFGEDRGGGRFGRDRGGKFGDDKGGRFERKSDENDWGGSDRHGSGFGGENRGGRFGGDNRRGGGFGGDKREGGGFGGDNRGGGGFGGDKREGDGFGGDKRGGGFGGDNRGGDGFGGDKRGGDGFGGDKRGDGFGGDRRGGRGFGGDRRAGGGFGGDKGGGGGFGGDNRRGGGFGGDNRGGGGFGGDRRGGGGFGGDRRGGGGFGGDRRAGGGFGGDKGGGGGFGGDNRGGGGGFGGDNRGGSAVDEDWGSDSVPVVKSVPMPSVVKDQQPSMSVKSRFRGMASVSSSSNVTHSTCLTSLKLNVGKFYEVFVIYTVTPGNFWCQLSLNCDKIRDLLDEMSQYYTEIPEQDLQLIKYEKKNICAAKFSEDNMWYRAEITDVHSENVEVLFVDYGNSSSIPLCDVRQLAEQFFETPQQGLKFGLISAKPIQSSGWSDEASEEFENMTSEKQLKAEVMQKNDNVFLVQLEGTECGNIGIKLAEKGFCSLASVKQLQLSTYPVLKVDVFQTSVSVSWIDNPCKFYCQLLDNQEELNELTEKLQADYESGQGADMSVDNVSVGMGIIAMFSEDQAWYRAEVIAADTDGITVYFVDFGNYDTIPLDSLRKPLPHHLELPAQAILCCLKGIKPLINDNWLADAKQIMESLVENEVKCTFHEYKDQIHLVSIDAGHTDVANELVNAAVAKFCPADASEFLVSESIPLSQTQNISKPQPCLAYAYICLKPEESEKVYVSHIDSLESFWCQLVKFSTELELLMIELGKKGSEAPMLDAIDVGMLCLAKYSVDEQWYRAVIRSSENNAALVHFVDYGNSETVGMNDICAIKEDMMGMPAQAIKCSLHLKQNCTADKEKLEEAVMDKELEILVQIILSDGTARVDLKENGSSIVSSLMESETDLENVPSDVIEIETDLEKGSSIVSDAMEAESVETVSTSLAGATDIGLTAVNAALDRYSDPDWPIGNKHDSFVSYSMSPGQFYIQLASQETELNQLMSLLEKSYGSLKESELVLKNPIDEQPCCAKYSGDGSWYRGVVKHWTHNDVTVYFIDYGNVETVENKDVKQLMKEFLDIRPLALQCTLSMVPPDASDWSAEAIAQFDLLTFEKKLSCNFISCGHVELENDDGDVGSNLVTPANVTDLNHASAYLPICTPPPATDAHMSYVEDVHFYLQLADNKDDINNMPTKLLEIDSNRQRISPEALKIGHACMILYDVDSVWYRAVILAIMDHDCEVRFVDCGESHTLSCKNIYYLPTNVAQSPPLALKCQLKYITEWSHAQRKKFQYLTEDKVLTVQFLSQDAEPYRVELADDEMKDINRAMEEVDYDAPSVLVCNYAGPGLAVADKTKVVVGNIVSTNSFWCQLVENLHRLESLMTFITQIYNHRVGKIAADELCIGMSCIAKFSKDEKWYRGTILKIGETDCDVLFIDYGNIEIVSLSDLQEINKSHVEKWPAHAFQCRLDFSADVGNSPEKVVLFHELTDNRELEMEVVEELPDGVFKIVLRDGETCLNDVMPEKKQKNSEKVAETENLEDADFPEFVIDDSEIIFHTDGMKSLKMTEEQRIQVTVSHSDSPTAFWMQPIKGKEELDMLLIQMYDYYNDLAEGQLLIETPQIGMICAAKYSADDSWYRAKVSGMTDTNEYEVHFLDHGNKDTLTSQSFRFLVGYFGSLPIQAIKCSLAGVSSNEEDWSDNAKTFFEELTVEKSLLADIIQVRTDGRCIVQLMDMGMSVGQTLVQHGFGMDSSTPVSLSRRVRRVFSDTSDVCTPVKLLTTGDSPFKSCIEITEFPKPELEESEKHTVVVSHSTSPQNFWCQLKASSDILLKISDSVQESYSSHSDPLHVTDMKPGKACIILYSKNDTYYRSGITTVGEDTVNVLFVDYGIDTSVKKSDVKMIKPEHLEVSHQAVPCALVNTCSNTYSGQWNENACDRFKELTDEKQLVAEIMEINPATLLLVQLYDNNISIREILVSEGLAIEEVKPVEISNLIIDGTILENMSESESDESEFHSMDEAEAGLEHGSEIKKIIDADTIGNVEEDDKVNEELSERLMEEKKNDKSKEIESVYLENQESSDEESSSADGMESSANESTLDSSMSCPYVFRTLDIGNEYFVTVSEVVSPEKFFVHLSSDHLDGKKLSSEISEYVNNNLEEKMEHCRVGEACLAFCNQKEAWCRARIDGVNEDNIEVFLVDCGPTLIVSSVSVRPLPVQFLMYPTQAVMCRLSDIIPRDEDTWSEEAVNFFKSCCDASDCCGILVDEEFAPCYYSTVVSVSQDSPQSLCRMMVTADFATVIPDSNLEQLISQEDLDLESSFLEVSIQRENSFGDSSFGSEDAADDSYHTLDVTGFTDMMCSFNESQVLTNEAIIDLDREKTIDDLEKGSDASSDDAPKECDVVEDKNTLVVDSVQKDLEEVETKGDLAESPVLEDSTDNLLKECGVMVDSVQKYLEVETIADLEKSPVLEGTTDHIPKECDEVEGRNTSLESVHMTGQSLSGDVNPNDCEGKGEVFGGMVESDNADVMQQEIETGNSQSIEDGMVQNYSPVDDEDTYVTEELLDIAELVSTESSHTLGNENTDENNVCSLSAAHKYKECPEDQDVQTTDDTNLGHQISCDDIGQTKETSQEVPDVCGEKTKESAPVSEELFVIGESKIEEVQLEHIEESITTSSVDEDSLPPPDDETCDQTEDGTFVIESDDLHNENVPNSENCQHSQYNALSIQDVKIGHEDLSGLDKAGSAEVHTESLSLDVEEDEDKAAFNKIDSEEISESGGSTQNDGLYHQNTEGNIHVAEQITVNLKEGDVSPADQDYPAPNRESEKIVDEVIPGIGQVYLEETSKSEVDPADQDYPAPNRESEKIVDEVIPGIGQVYLEETSKSEVDPADQDYPAPNRESEKIGDEIIPGVGQVYLEETSKSEVDPADQDYPAPNRESEKIGDEIIPGVGQVYPEETSKSEVDNIEPTEDANFSPNYFTASETTLKSD